MLQSFFGRTCSNPNGVSECKNEGNCVIDKKSRTSCKACRLQKCLDVGMSKASSRYGRRSNWFKISHALGQNRENEEKKKLRIPIPSLGFHQSPLLPPSSVSLEAERNTASTSQANSENHANDAASSHNGFLSSNWLAKFQSQLPVAPIQPIQVSTLNELLPSVDNQIQQNPIVMQYAMTLSESYRSILEAIQLRATSESDFSDVESRSSSSRVSPLINRTDEPPPSNSRVSINGSLMLMDAHNPYINLYSLPSMITPATYPSVRGGDSLLVSPNPGGLADELDEPIDLSMRASGSSSQSNESFEKRGEKKDQINNDSLSTEEDAAKPLDLTLDATPLKLNL